MEKKIYPSLETTLILSEFEMNNTLGGGPNCKSEGCKNGCLEACKEGRRDGGSYPEESQLQ